MEKKRLQLGEKYMWRRASYERPREGELINLEPLTIRFQQEVWRASSSGRRFVPAGAGSGGVTLETVEEVVSARYILCPLSDRDEWQAREERKSNERYRRDLDKERRREEFGEQVVQRLELAGFQTGRGKDFRQHGYGKSHFIVSAELLDQLLAHHPVSRPPGQEGNALAELLGEGASSPEGAPPSGWGGAAPHPVLTAEGSCASPSRSADNGGS